MCCYYGHRDLVSDLFLNGIDIKIKNNYGSTAITEAYTNQIKDDINNYFQNNQNMIDYIEKLRKEELIKLVYYVYAP